jgi:hypothetical protein
MGRYGAPRPARVILGTLFGTGVFLASSIAVFTLAASAGTSLLSPVTDTVSNVVSGVGNTVNGGTSLLCQLACATPSAAPQQPSTQSLQSQLACLAPALCQQQPSGTGSTSGSSTGSSSAPAPEPQPGTAQTNAPRAPAGSDPLSGPQGIAATTGSLVQPPPPSITLPTAAGGINFGKAPFLWPLFLGLDVLGAGAVLLALRKTWSKPVAD